MQITNDRQRSAFPRKKRGALLTAFIGYQLVVNVFGLLLTFAAGRVFLHHMPAWIVALDLVTFMGMTAGLLATLKWKRIGVYSVFGLYFLEILENFVLGRIFGTIISLGIAVAFVTLLRSHWRDLH